MNVEGLLYEGLKLMVVGMTTVLLFLTLMVFLIQAAAYLTRGITARELQALLDEKERLKREREQAKRDAQGGDDDIVVITAAIAAFEAERAAAVSR